MYQLLVRTLIANDYDVDLIIYIFKRLKGTYTHMYHIHDTYFIHIICNYILRYKQSPAHSRRFQAPPPRQPQVPFPSKAGHSTPAPFPSGSGHSMHKRPSNQWRAPSFEHRPTTNRGNAHERRETQPLNNTNRPKPLMTIETRPPLQPLQTRNTAATTLRQNTQQQCQLCLGFDHTAVTCRSKEQTCYNCHQVGHLSRAFSVV